MLNNQSSVGLVSTSQSNIANNIVGFLQADFHPNNDIDNSFLLIANKTIYIFIFMLIYLFSALEEADWNVFSANSKNNEEVIDESIWSIYYFAESIIRKANFINF
tara:strand:+ start:420 stop:734 length:315 start_codon:yes stop_codon:yes gene_type:complete